jgi:predicted DsbA family dithiol-disulfide isomerase
VLLQRVRDLGRDFEVAWRYFSLSQVNRSPDRVDEGWTVWDAPPGEVVRGRLAFQAAEAARRQDAFDRLHLPLLEARHGERRDLADREVVVGVARAVGLDLERFERELDDSSTLEALARDHQEGVDQHGVFGTPTFVFPDGGSAYVRVRPAPEGEEALALFDQLVGIISAEPYVLELKRPSRPS